MKLVKISTYITADQKEWVRSEAFRRRMSEAAIHQEAIARRIAELAYEELERRLIEDPEAIGAKDLSIVAGVAVDKSQVLTGQATAIHSWAPERRANEDDYDLLMQQAQAVDAEADWSDGADGADGTAGAIFDIIEKSFLNYSNGQLEGKAFKLGEKSDTVFSGSYVNGNLVGMAKVVINERGDYSISNYVAGVRKGDVILYNKNGKKIVKNPVNRTKNNNTIKPIVPAVSQKSHVCNYCGKTFSWEGFYLAGTREGIVMQRSHNDNQELCCSSVCAYKIMGM
jgi:hypothetical protein